MNKDQLNQSANERYKQSILSLIGVAQGRYPLPAHLEYMVSVKDRLSVTPSIMFSIVTKKPDVTSEDVLAYIEAALPAQMDIPEGVRWLEDQVRTKGLDLREALKPEDMAGQLEFRFDATNPGH